MKNIYRISAFILSLITVLMFSCVTSFAYQTVTENGITYSSANLKDTDGNFGEYYKVEYCSPTVTGAVSIKAEISGVPVVQISKEVFKGKTGITEITIPSSIAKIEDSAFENCSALKTVRINSEKCQLGKRAFKNCFSLEEANIPEKITGIPQEAFYGCSKLAEVSVPSEVAVIGADAFSLCSSLTSITLPKGVYSIGKNAFSNCAGIEEFIVDSLNTSFKAVGGVLYSYDGRTLIQYPNGKSETTVSVPEGTEAIGDFAFGANTVIEKIIIPNSVKTISAYAFCDCTALSDISVPEGVESIGSMAFGRCTALKETTLPASLKSFEGAFYQSSVEKINLKDGITLIDDKAFEGCEKLNEINIPESVKIIGMGSFDSCCSLENLVIPKTVENIGENAFINCGLLRPTVEIGSPAHKYCLDNDISCIVRGNRKITSLTVKAMPEKTSYYYKESLDTDGLVLYAVYNDFTNAEITSGYTVTPEYFDSTGTKTISVVYGNATTSFNVKVSYSWWQILIRIFLLGMLWY